MAEFRTRYVKRDKPVLMTGAVSDWRSVETWTTDYLKDKTGDQEIAVIESKTGIFAGDPNSGLPAPEIISFRAFLDEVFREPEGRRLALMETSIPDRLPALMADIPRPRYLDGLPVFNTNIWIGRAGNITKLHYDAYQNLLVQVRGRKRVYLFSSSEIGRLYPYSPFSKVPHNFQVNLSDADLKTFPLLATLKPVVAELGPGDALFIPFCWPHEVRTLENSVSVNIWWKGRRLHYLEPSFLRMLPALLRPPNLKT